MKLFPTWFPCHDFRQISKLTASIQRASQPFPSWVIFHSDDLHTLALPYTELQFSSSIPIMSDFGCMNNIHLPFQLQRNIKLNHENWQLTEINKIWIGMECTESSVRFFAFSASLFYKTTFVNCCQCQLKVRSLCYQLLALVLGSLPESFSLAHSLVSDAPSALSSPVPVASLHLSCSSWCLLPGLPPRGPYEHTVNIQNYLLRHFST